jgi:hypothetical protein
VNEQRTIFKPLGFGAVGSRDTIPPSAYSENPPTRWPVRFRACPERHGAITGIVLCGRDPAAHKILDDLELSALLDGNPDALQRQSTRTQINVGR